MLIESCRTAFPLVLTPSVDQTPTAGDVDPAIDLRVGQLLCSRLCHDLIGPATAINAGGELIADGNQEENDVHALIVESARQLAGRLTFFRIAFGYGSSRGGGTSCAEARDLADNFLHGSRVRLCWSPEKRSEPDTALLSADSVRLLLCLVMLAADTLPRGGRVVVSISTRGSALLLSLTANGASQRLADDVVEALRAKEAGGLTPRTVYAFYLSCLSARLSASLAIDATDEGLQMLAQVPHAQGAS
jgi:histidine phosphotransferase ChpT